MCLEMLFAPLEFVAATNIKPSSSYVISLLSLFLSSFMASSQFVYDHHHAGLVSFRYVSQHNKPCSVKRFSCLPSIITFVSANLMPFSFSFAFHLSKLNFSSFTRHQTVFCPRNVRLANQITLLMNTFNLMLDLTC